MVAEKTKKIIENEKLGKRALITILQKVQSEYNYLPVEALNQIALTFEMPLAEVYSVATFYKTFSFKPRGKHCATVCLGTACHVRGAGRILSEAEKALGVKAGETTPDNEYTLETVNCLGACALGPIIVLDKTYHGLMTPKKTEGLFKKKR
ncbi:MAG: NAD(P)H-dependent oxidoreductase subunit E [Elusimicrobia bacterium]|nr:NAD(P)H-dependent oxidoreductase subunit E [Elusimicrobiota bacterium]